MNKSIGVLGCGWLGFPLAQKLVEQGYEVHGSTTSPEKLNLLQSKGIEPYRIALQADKITGEIDELVNKVQYPCFAVNLIFRAKWLNHAPHNLVLPVF
ncbi:MAG: NAD(P)-binding domain-containing protein, partial [Bacteroidota bacterium]